MDEKYICGCKSCACQCYGLKRQEAGSENIPPNAIVFELPKFREPNIDTYSHTVYMKEMCNRPLMKQHVNLAQKRKTPRRKKPPVVEQERFSTKTTAKSDFRRYNPREAAACKAQFPRTKRKEDFYFSPGEYSCESKFPTHPFSHYDYAPKLQIPSFRRIGKKECDDLPPFKGASCYVRDYTAPPLDAYLTVSRKPRKKGIFN